MILEFYSELGRVAFNAFSVVLFFFFSVSLSVCCIYQGDCFSVPNKSLYHHGDRTLTDTLEHAKAPKMAAR